MNRDFRIVAEQVRLRDEGGEKGGEIEKGGGVKGEGLEGFPIEHARLRSLRRCFFLAFLYFFRERVFERFTDFFFFNWKLDCNSLRICSFHK